MKAIKIFAKNEKEVETLIQTVKIYNQDIGIQFGIEKYTMLVKKKGGKEKQQIELPNQENIWMLREKENYKYLKILKVETIKKQEWKKK